MKKALSVSNAALYLVFCSLASSGLTLEFRLDYPSQRLLGLTKHNWATLHTIAALVFVSTALVHLWVNRAWLRAVLLKMRWPTAMVIALGLTLVALTALAPVD